MTKPRKKWRLQYLPSFRYARMSSRAQAYREVEQAKALYALRMSRTHHVNVEVDEGHGWVLYERIIFPPPSQEEA